MRDGGAVSQHAWFVLCVVSATGCSAVFGLDRPVHDDGGTTDSLSRADANRDAPPGLFAGDAVFDELSICP